jgi:phosphoglycolate phosphatase-like HAD superfamily hydrolase
VQQPNEDATTEQRERAVRYWQEVVRPQLNAKNERAKPKESPEEALARLKAQGWSGVVLSPSLTKILGIKNEQAA